MIQQMLPHPNGQAPPPTLQARAGRRNGRIYSLHVEQQPVRARMCGFGDKDRRPITPPPCVRLIVCDEVTGKEIDVNEVDSSFFVLSVDLWSADGTQEVNLVRHAGMLPVNSISAATTTSFPPPPDHRVDLMAAHGYGQPMPGVPGGGLVGMYPGMPQRQYGMPVSPMGGMMSPGYPMQPHQGYGAPGGAPSPMVQVAPGGGSGGSGGSTSGMFTRNLIGSLSVNAFKLSDCEDKVGFWFVLQDLSVRTDGPFRLKMNFTDVGQDGHLNTGKAPVLASTYSDVFTVFSAKKFPGVIESTPLSKRFAEQGIKIPIRKDGPKVLSNQAEYDQDDD